MPFPASVREDALVKSGRHCCLCHRFVGLKIEVHHIEPEAASGNNTMDNAIALCFDCHADMINYDPKHPKGTKYTISELKRHRNSWYSRAANAVPSGGDAKLFSSDRSAYEWLIGHLDWDTCIGFLRSHDFGNVFHNQKLNGLYEVWEAREDPSRQFLDPTVEAIRASLIQEIGSFIDAIAELTEPVAGKLPMQKISREWHGRGGLDEQAFFAAQRRLNDLASKVCGLHAALVAEVRSRLG